MNEKKPSLDSLIKGGKFCVKCASTIPSDEIGHKCEIIECPKPKEKKNKRNNPIQFQKTS